MHIFIWKCYRHYSQWISSVQGTSVYFLEWIQDIYFCRDMQKPWFCSLHYTACSHSRIYRNRQIFGYMHYWTYYFGLSLMKTTASFFKNIDLWLFKIWHSQREESRFQPRNDFHRYEQHYGFLCIIIPGHWIFFPHICQRCQWCTDTFRRIIHWYFKIHLE